ncbi:hypothetical protein MESS2_740044 [Mesorhizobium metallidurans STM 2683]|uniref:Uncharacterized protein n=1 Tax=Mesorhizobium metallidurans STM 2683 TaxID=1297569 RepID=M5EW09_9HYPH|nr:hypothetical protein [Mesorhizobium metallidurans]CCV08417.1 hypothetical protein MESS2_740044 [Mesorhizobium metallidurans STM 2683]
MKNFDMHGEGGGQSIRYEKGRGVPGSQGTLEAASKAITAGFGAIAVPRTLPWFFARAAIILLVTSLKKSTYPRTAR